MKFQNEVFHPQQRDAEKGIREAVERMNKYGPWNSSSRNQQKSKANPAANIDGGNMGSGKAMDVGFDFAIGQSVKVKALDLPAQVIGLMVSESGQKFRIVYWSDGSRKTEWVFAWEIQ